jgi:hypothetical protein
VANIKTKGGVVQEGMKYAIDIAMEKAVDKAAEYLVGAHLTDFDAAKNGDGYKLTADDRLATKLVSGFLTILIAAAGGTLTAVSGGAAMVTAIAVVVWVGEKDEEETRKRWGEMVGSIMKNYDNIRAKRLHEINERHKKELASMVMSNANHDLEDANELGSY